MNTHNLFLWTAGGYLSGITLSVGINILHNKELSRSTIYRIMFVTTSICFLRGFTGKSILENICSVLL